jgi:hypothetical protein
LADHPVKVPPELVASLRNSAPHGIRDAGVTRELWLIDHAYTAGADEQLYEVNDWIRCSGSYPKTDIRWELDMLQLDRLGRELWQAMRPKPPTLAEQGLEALRSTPCTEQRHYDAMFAALNRLAKLEAQQ